MKYNYWRCIDCNRTFRTRNYSPNQQPACPFCGSKRLAATTKTAFDRDRGLC